MSQSADIKPVQPVSQFVRTKLFYMNPVSPDVLNQPYVFHSQCC